MKKKLNCILLIDDDIPTNFINKKVIESSQCTNQIQVALNGIEALKYLEKAGSGQAETLSPDLIFLDINMPAMNGWEFIEKYKELPLKTKSKVIIMLTTSPNPDDMERAMNQSVVSGFERKPLTKQKLQKIIHEHFGEEYSEDIAA